MIVYHGSNVRVESPKILSNGFYKDFGYGFYCTEIKRQAQRWALSKRGDHVVSAYEYNEQPKLKIKKFDTMTDEWLDFIVRCHRGLTHNYDIVEGPMADDTIWDYIEDFVDGNITREAFWELARFRHPTHQIVFCTEEALHTISFERSFTVE